ncbi:MAG: polysaccharide deacetylase family protein [Promethearchaeota archaeon]
MKIIKKVIKEVIGLILRFSGLLCLIREIFLKNKVTIIKYHCPSSSIFKKHIEYLSKHYNFISLNKLINAIYQKNCSSIPPKSLIITIDDGFKENYNLFNIFKTYRSYPTIYVCSHIINTNRNFWWKTGFRNSKKLKRLKNKYRLKVLKEKIGYNPTKEYSTRQALSLEEINEMMPYVDFQSHTKFHPILTTCTDVECKEEIKVSKEYLEKLLNKKIEHFCYPNGEYNFREVRYLINCGYKSGRTLDIGWNDINSDPYRLKAMDVEDDASINVLVAQIIGIFGYVRYLRHGGLKGVRPPFI